MNLYLDYDSNVVNIIVYKEVLTQTSMNSPHEGHI